MLDRTVTWCSSSVSVFYVVAVNMSRFSDCYAGQRRDSSTSECMTPDCICVCFLFVIFRMYKIADGCLRLWMFCTLLMCHHTLILLKNDY